MVRPTGYSLSRRDLLVGAAALTISSSAKSSTPACTLVSEQEEGPFYIDEEKLRQDITEGQPGVPLKLRIALVDAKRCQPLPNAALDIWHCDAMGLYSGFTSSPLNGPPAGRQGRPGPPPGEGPGGPDGRQHMGPPRPRQKDKTRYLRGVQLSDRQGMIEFATIYPGWYSGRCIHIHTKVHLGGSAGEETYAGGRVCHTGQLFFPEEITNEIAKLSPYEKRLSVARTMQDEDMVFTSQHGEAGMLKLERLRNGSNVDGFLATVTIAVDPEASPGPVGFGGPGGRR